MSGVIYPTLSLNSFRVGLSSTRSFDAGDVARRGALDRTAHKISRVDRVSAVHGSEIKTRAKLKEL